MRRLLPARSLALVAGAALAALGLPAAAASSAVAEPPVPPGAVPPAAVAITADGFDPSDLAVAAGDTVKWTNQAGEGHTVTGPFFNSGALADGETYSVTFDDPGTIVFRDVANLDEEGNPVSGTVVVGDGVSPPPEPRPVLRVPSQYPTISAAVNGVANGSKALILVAEGVYRETVVVRGAGKAGITIRGESMNGTIVDGEDSRSNGILVDQVPDVTVEDITIQHFETNGLYFSFSDRFLGDRVKSIDNEIYGIYSFHAVDGTFRNSYASESGDGGFYVGECADCRIVIDNVLAEGNVLGYTGTNAGTVTISNSEFRDNGIGIVPNNLPLLEEDAPPRNGTFVGNWIHDNNGWEITRHGFPDFFYFPPGIGIWVAGGWGFTIEGNLIENHDRHGVLVSWLSMPALDNVVRGNIVKGGAKGDLAYDGLGTGNRFCDNDSDTSSPPLIHVLYDCDLPQTVGIPYPLPDADVYYGVARHLTCTQVGLEDVCPRDIPYPPGPSDPPQ